MRKKNKFHRVVCSEFVQIVAKLWNALLQTLALTGRGHHLGRLGLGVKGVAGENLPVVKDALREGLTAGVGAEVGGEAKRLVHGQIRLHHKHGRAHDLILLDHVATPTIEDAVNAADRGLRALDLDKVDGLEQAGRGGEHAGVQTAPSGRDNLAAAAMNGVRVERHVVHVEPDAAAILLAQHALLS